MLHGLVTINKFSKAAREGSLFNWTGKWGYVWGDRPALWQAVMWLNSPPSPEGPAWTQPPDLSHTHLLALRNFIPRYQSRNGWVGRKAGSPRRGGTAGWLWLCRPGPEHPPRGGWPRRAAGLPVVSRPQIELRVKTVRCNATSRHGSGVNSGLHSAALQTPGLQTAESQAVWTGTGSGSWSVPVSRMQRGIKSKAGSKVPPSSYCLSCPIYLSFRCDCVRIFWFSISFSNIIPLWSSNMSNTIILIQGSLLSFLLKFSMWLMFVNILCTWEECACTNCQVFWIYLMAQAYLCYLQQV